MLIRADEEPHAPTQAESGLYLASSLTAAVEGEDAEPSWFVGTVLQVGPLVNRFEARPVIARWLEELEADGHDILPAELRCLRARIDALPAESPDPIRCWDRVVFSWAAGQRLMIDEDQYIIVRANEVLAVLTDS